MDRYKKNLNRKQTIEIKQVLPIILSKVKKKTKSQNKIFIFNLSKISDASGVKNLNARARKEDDLQRALLDLFCKIVCEKMIPVPVPVSCGANVIPC